MIRKTTRIVINIVNSQALQHEYLQDLFHLPMSQPAYEEFLQLEEVCSHAQNLSIQQNPDFWSYIWGSSDFCSKKAYSMMMGHYEVIPHFSWLWNSSCQPRHKFFFWLFSMTDLTPETCWAGRTSTYKVMIVSV
jgi:hypothetical protein